MYRKLTIVKVFRDVALTDSEVDTFGKVNAKVIGTPTSKAQFTSIGDSRPFNDILDSVLFGFEWMLGI